LGEKVPDFVLKLRPLARKVLEGEVLTVEEEARFAMLSTMDRAYPLSHFFPEIRALFEEDLFGGFRNGDDVPEKRTEERNFI
jgi:hypothetical protein